MTTPAIITVIKMIEELPEPIQNQVVDHLQEYLSELNEELEWDASFHATQPRLARLAKGAHHQIAEGKDSPYERLI
jgi:hypothetical protein